MNGESLLVSSVARKLHTNPFAPNCKSFGRRFSVRLENPQGVTHVDRSPTSGAFVCPEIGIEKGQALTPAPRVFESPNRKARSLLWKG